MLGTNAGALSFGTTVPSTTTANKPIGISYATVSSNNYLFTANQGNSTLWSFLLTIASTPSPPIEFGSGLDAPTGLVVDPQNAFLYTTNQNAGTVSQVQLTPACINNTGTCSVTTIATEKPANASSGPFGITLAQ